jgi:hypothetical protein
MASRRVGSMLLAGVLDLGVGVPALGRLSLHFTPTGQLVDHLGGGVDISAGAASAPDPFSTSSTVSRVITGKVSCLRDTRGSGATVR